MKIRKRLTLKKARQEMDLTQAQTADYLGIATTSYQAIELGIKLGSIRIWDALEDLFGIPQRQLRAQQSAPDTNQALEI